MKKPNLSTIKEAMERRNVYVHPDGTSIKLALSGFYSVQKAGQSRIFSTLRDAWMAI